MSVKEMAYNIVDSLTEEQLKGFILMFGGDTGSEVPGERLLEAFEEAEEMKKNPEKYKGYTNVDEMMRDILE